MLSALSDKTLGGVMLLVATSLFVYYTIWAIFLPFLEASSPVHDLFPAREWAVRVPALILVLGISSIGIFLSTKILQGTNTGRLGSRRPLERGIPIE